MSTEKRSHRITNEQLYQALDAVPTERTPFDLLARRWLQIFPAATAWQITEIARRLERRKLILRASRGIYYRPIGLPVEVKKTQPTPAPAPNPKGIQAVTDSPPNLFTESTNIAAKYEKKIAAIWSYFDWCDKNKQRPSKELFESMYNDINR